VFKQDTHDKFRRCHLLDFEQKTYDGNRYDEVEYYKGMTMRHATSIDANYSSKNAKTTLTSINVGSISSLDPPTESSSYLGEAFKKVHMASEFTLGIGLRIGLRIALQQYEECLKKINLSVFNLIDMV